MGNDELKKRVAERLREIRGDMNQTNFAELVGATQGQVCAWEKGRAVPNLEHLASIRRATGADLNALVEAAGKIETKEEGHE